MKKRLVMVFTVVLMLIFFSHMPSSTKAATSYSSLTSDSIKQKEEQIKQAEQQKKSLQNSLTDVKAIKKKLEQEKSNLKNYVQELDAQLAEVQDNITRLTAEIQQKEEEIRVTQEELAEAKQIEEDQYDAMVERIRFMYEQGESSYIDIIFSGESLSSIMNAVEYMEQISAYDRKQLDQFILNRQYIELCEQQLEAEKEVLDETKVSVEQEQKALEELIAAKEQTIREYEYDISNREQAIKEYEADIQEQNEIVQALEAAIAEEKRKILEQNGTVLMYDGGQFKFPVATYTRLSDDYGWRMHPILGVQKFHNGIDLASPSGTAIYAAYDGKVVAASYSSSMGNYVMIDHGGSLYTIYMHASKLYVSTGDVVVRGETIAAVGSTGRSTGPHLHFGVRLNGEYVSPWNYLKQ